MAIQANRCDKIKDRLCYAGRYVDDKTCVRTPGHFVDDSGIEHLEPEACRSLESHKFCFVSFYFLNNSRVSLVR